MQPFITYTEAGMGQPEKFYILQRKHPYVIGEIKTMPTPDAIAEVKIPGYNFWVCFDGVIEGRYFPVSADPQAAIVKSLSLMAEWYLNNRIAISPNKYKKHITHAGSANQ